MVQAAAQAQAVVAAAKSRGDGLVPMNAAQIAALSQIQAQAIVHARKTNNNTAASASGKNSSQIQTQIQLQAQALVHAHTQAQIAAGIYKGDDGAASSTTGGSGSAAKTAAVAMEQDDAAAAMDISKTNSTSTNIVAPSSIPPSILPPPSNTTAHMMDTSATATSSNSLVPQAPAPSSSSPQFLAQLNASLNSFWKDQLHMVHELPPSQTEQDFKTHNDLPLARIKRIMKSDEDVRMISAEAPVLFAKACELFILDLSIRSWNYSQLHKRRTLQKEDIREAIQKTDIFDFLVDVI